MKKLFNLSLVVFLVIGMFSLVGCNGIWDFDDDDDTVPKISFNFPAKVNLTNAAGGTLLANAANDYSKLKCVVYQQSTVAGTADTAVSGEIDVAANGDVTVSFQGFAGSYYLKFYNPNNANMVLYKYLGQLTANITTSQTVNETSTAVGMIIQDAKTNGSVLTTTDVTDTDAAVVTVATNIGTAIAAGNSVGSVSAAIAPTAIAAAPTTASIEVGKTQDVTVTFTPAYTTNQKVTFASSDTTVATVAADGKITAVKAGTATITVTSVADTTKTATVAVTVIAKPVAVTGVTMSSTTASVAAGSTTTITATIQPSDATTKTGTWTSSNTSVATIKATGLTCVVTGVAAGEATIKFTTTDGSKEATCLVTVTKAATGVKAIPLSPAVSGQNTASTQIVIRGVDYTTYTNSVTIQYTQSGVTKDAKFIKNDQLSTQFKEVTLIPEDSALSQTSYAIPDFSSLNFDSEVPFGATVAVYDLDTNKDKITYTVPTPK